MSTAPILRRQARRRRRSVIKSVDVLLEALRRGALLTKTCRGPSRDALYMADGRRCKSETVKLAISVGAIVPVDPGLFAGPDTAQTFAIKPKSKFP